METLANSSTLCFDKHQFMKEDFDVDEFVADCRRRVQLEQLREDLDVYFRSLKNAMVELINKDYADFVNLSSNLVGMDKAINSLAIPLGQLREEVLSVKSVMEDAEKAVQQKLLARAKIREKKACLQRLININKSVEKMEVILGIRGSAEGIENDDGEIELTGQQIERVASEFNQLQYYVTQSKGLPLVEKIRPRIAAITVTLQHSLERMFKESLETGNVDMLRQCLRTYGTIDKMRDAEALFRKVSVSPYMAEVISERFIQTNPQGLKGLFSKVMEFIPKSCGLIREVTSPLFSSGSEKVVGGYNFMVNAVWPEIVSSLENRVASIFAPGNPDAFHQKYLISMEFVDQFERECGSQTSVKHLRAHPSYNTFMSKWSLPVYFQIRFQEIAGSVEMALMAPFNASTGESCFKLAAFDAIWHALQCCWQDQVYLTPLAHRFWKLTLQIILRCTTWIAEVHENEVAGKTSNIDDQPPSSDGDKTTEDKSPPVTMAQIVFLIGDVDKLYQQLPSLLTDYIEPRLTSICKDTSFLTESFEEARSRLIERQGSFNEFIVKEVCGLCSVHLKSANDIPRLYRRTNREVPSKPSSYIHNTMKPLELFIQEHGQVLEASRQQQLLAGIFTQIVQEYNTVSSDLLTSVKKMEDSLKRLKMMRKSDVGLPQSSQGLSDDDKIRLQLAIDVRKFGEQISSLGVEKQQVKGYEDLSSLVESSVKKPAEEL
ncbi:conserved oligomeric Golgi complex subunit 2-like [Anneissia japonica]|uniref:conserved oligomeric Golgi complex subunit 2-like n=1 Tax=Anneissia japonica TaxID=1529436 RepID=UPI0014255B4D|nr:conserved oligomeric Golgi complex subunit 2-like [Anneissia japonica]